MEDPFGVDIPQPAVRAKGGRKIARTVDPLGNTSAKRKSTNFNPRAAKYFEDQGCFFQMVETHNMFSGKKHDLFGIIDAVAVGGDGPIVGVQIGREKDIEAKIRKAFEPFHLKRLRAWLLSGGRYVILGFTKGKQGCKVRELALADLP